MQKRVLLLVVGGLVLLLVIPVVVAQVNPPAERTLVGVSLADTGYQEVSFHNEAQDIDLAGMLFLPEGDGPFPGVVIIHGAGTSKRDNHWYLNFTTYLRNNGIAVLLPDKRGSESSEGDWRTASFHDLTTDTVAAIDYLKASHADVIAEIGVLGASQGGQVVPIVATESDVAFAINVVGSAVPFHEALQYEENHNLQEMGFLPGFSNVIAYASSWYIRNVSQREFWGPIQDYDPLPYWAEVDVPGLVLLGDIDTNTPSQQSADRLNALGNSNLRVVIFEGSGHPLEDPEGMGNSNFRSDALELLRDFILGALANG